MNTEIAIVTIAGLPLISVNHNGIAYAPMKNLSEAVGLPWDAQRQRIQDTEILREGAMMIKVPLVSGGHQEVLCLPVRLAFAWLLTVPLKRIQNPETRRQIKALQLESLDALVDYWVKGSAHNPRFAQQARNEMTRQAIACKNLPATLDRLEKARHATTHRIDLALARAHCEALGIAPPTAADYPLIQAELFGQDQRAE